MDTQSKDEGSEKATFVVNGQDLTVYATAMITDRNLALRVLRQIYSEVQSTTNETFDHIDLSYRLTQKKYAVQSAHSPGSDNRTWRAKVKSFFSGLLKRKG